MGTFPTFRVNAYSNDDRAQPVSRARFVLKHDPALAQAVMSDAETLNAAHDRVRAQVGRVA